MRHPKTILTALCIAAALPLCAHAAFPTNNNIQVVTLANARDDFNDFEWSWHGFEDQYCRLKFVDSGTITSYSAYWKMSQDHGAAGRVTYLYKGVSAMTVSGTNITWTVTHGNLENIPNGAYFSEVILLDSASSNKIRTMAQWTIRVEDSLFDDDDSTFSGSTITNLTDYLSIASAAATYLKLDTSNDPLTGALAGTNATFQGTLTGEQVTSSDDALVTDDLSVGGNASVTGSLIITEGALADSTVVSADIKNDTIDSADYAADSIDDEHINWGESALENSVEGLIFDADAETIAGNWVNTTYPWADNEVANNLTVDDAGIAATITRDSEWDTRDEVEAVWAGTTTIWCDDNDGAASGLDADTVDGVEAAAIIQADGSVSMTADLNMGGQDVTNAVSFWFNNGDRIYSDGSNLIYEDN